MNTESHIAASPSAIVAGPPSALQAHASAALAGAGFAVTDHEIPTTGDAQAAADEARAAVAAHEPLDVLVFAPPEPRSAAILDAVAEWQQSLDATLTSAFAFAQAAARDMRGRGGSIVLMAWRGSGGATDTALHDGMVGLAKAMAVDLGNDLIRVNAVSLPTDDAAGLASGCAAAAFLAGHAASYITGSCVEIGSASIEATRTPTAIASASLSRRAIVTGAGGPIGRAISVALACDGFDVACWDVAPDPLEQTVAAVRAVSQRALAQQVDISSLDAVRAAIAECGPPAVVVNNAAVISIGHALDVGAQEWERVLRINLSGALYTSAAAAEALHAEGYGGVIVNVGSAAGVRPMRHRIHYCASKAGVHGLAAGLDRELGPSGVRSVAVAPKAVMSGMSASWLSAADGKTVIDAGGWIGDSGQREYVLSTLPIGRPGQPDDVARLVSFLASPQADGVHGTTIGIDGGYLAGDPVTQ